jgi:hypothetical protein
MGLLGAKVDAIDYYTALINKLNEQVSTIEGFISVPLLLVFFCIDFIIYSFTQPYNSLAIFR